MTHMPPGTRCNGQPSSLVREGQAQGGCGASSPGQLGIPLASALVLPLPVRRETKAPPPYVEAVSQSEEAVTKQMAAITRGMSGIVERAQQVRGAARRSRVATWTAQPECNPP